MKKHSGNKMDNCFKIVLGLALCLTLNSLGCGGSTSNRDQWQATLQNTSLSNEDKLVAMASQMLQTESVECIQADGRFQMNLKVIGVDPTAIVKTTAAMSNDAKNEALKYLQLRNLISPLANYIHYMESYHLGLIRVELLVQDVSGDTVAETRSRAYELELEPKDFAAFVAAAKLGPQEAIEKSEQLWKVTYDGWK